MKSKIRTFSAGRFHYTVEGKTVLVTKDTKDGGIVSVQLYTYRNEDEALDAAWGMQQKQLRA